MVFCYQRSKFGSKAGAGCIVFGCSRTGSKVRISFMKISINLLPPEIITEQTKNTKFYKIQYFVVFIIFVLIFLTSLTLALQILQSRNIVTAQAKVSESQQKVESLKNTQAALFVLKNRVSVISQYLGVPSKQSS